MNFCPDCGAKNTNPEAVFCSNCGYRFPAKEQESPPAQQPAGKAAAPPPEKPARQEQPLPASSSSPEKMQEDIFIIPKGAGAKINTAREPQPPAGQPSLFEQDDWVETGNLFDGGKAVPESVLPVQPTEKQPDAAFIEETTLRPAVGRQAPAPEKPAQQRPAEEVSSRVAAIEQQINDWPEEPPQPHRAGGLEEMQAEGKRQEPRARSHGTGSLEEMYEAGNRQEPPARRPAQQTRPPAYQPPRRQMESYNENYDDYDQEPKKKGSPVKWIVLAAVLVVLVVGGFFGVRALTGNPQDAISAFTTAVQAKDIETLKKITVLNNITNPTDANWMALCNGLGDAEQLPKLQAQLQAQVDAPRMLGSDFPAVRLVTKTNLLIFKKYTITLTGVTVTVPAGTADTLLRLDTVDYTGSTTGSGQVFSNVMPGRYVAQLVSSSSSEVASGMQMDIFTNIQWDAQPPAVGAPSGDGNGGIGSEPASSEAAASSSSSVAASAPTLNEAEVNTLLADFYKSYLDAINQQKLDPLRRSTQNMKTIVTERIKRPGNQQNTFEYVGASCTASTIKTGDSGGTPTLTFTATFKYKYTPREGGGEAKSGENKQTVQLVYTNNEWLVNKMENA